MGGSFQFKGLNYVTKIDATITYNKGAELITITLHVAEGEPSGRFLCPENIF